MPKAEPTPLRTPARPSLASIRPPHFPRLTSRLSAPAASKPGSDSVDGTGASQPRPAPGCQGTEPRPVKQVHPLLPGPTWAQETKSRGGERRHHRVEGRHHAHGARPLGPQGPQPTKLQPELTQKPSSCRLAFPSPLSIAQRGAVPCPGSHDWSTNQLLFLRGGGGSSPNPHCATWLNPPFGAISPESSFLGPAQLPSLWGWFSWAWVQIPLNHSEPLFPPPGNGTSQGWEMPPAHFYIKGQMRT